MFSSPTRKEKQAVLAYVVVLAGVVASARAGLFPGSGEAFDGSLFDHPYRLSMAVAGGVLAVALGVLAGWIGRRRENILLGIGVLAAGGLLTLFALSFNPYILYPGDQYPVSFGWLVAGAPLAGLAWLVAAGSSLRRSGRSSA